MTDRFIKFIPSEEAMYLLTQKGHAFRLLTIIAESARRYKGGADGLHIGEAFIGGFENYDMTERNYRTAKEILVKRRHIEIVETCRTRKKSTTGATTIGTKVRLLSTSVYNINITVTADRSDECPTTDRRPTDDKQEEQEVKNIKKQHPQSPSSVSVVVFSCLEKISDLQVSREEKIKITQKHQGNEQVVIDAVNAVTAEGFTPQQTLLKSLRAAIKQKWKSNAPCVEDVQKNKEFCRKLDMKTIGFNSFTASRECLEIVRGSISEIVRYDMPYSNFLKEIEKKSRTELNQIMQGISA